MGEKDDDDANEERARRPPPFPFPGEGRLSLPLDAFFLISWDSPTSQDLKENERRNQIGRDVEWTTDIRSLQVPETIPPPRRTPTLSSSTISFLTRSTLKVPAAEPAAEPSSAESAPP